MSGSGSFITGTTGAEVLSCCGGTGTNTISGNGTISNVTIYQPASPLNLNATGGVLTIDPTNSFDIGNIQVANGSTLHLNALQLENYNSRGAPVHFRFY